MKGLGSLGILGLLKLLGVFGLLSLLPACSREDGLPDPAPQVLVACNPDASSGDPLACSTDGGAD